MSRKIDPEKLQKLHKAKAFLSENPGRTIAEASEKFGIGLAYLYKWMRKQNAAPAKPRAKKVPQVFDLTPIKSNRIIVCLGDVDQVTAFVRSMQ
jgi:transposase-like protein